MVGVIFVVRRTLVFRSAERLAVRPDDSLTLSHWRTGYIVTYALCEGLALFGLILRFVGCSFQQSLPFYIGGFVLLLSLIHILCIRDRVLGGRSLENPKT